MKDLWRFYDGQVSGVVIALTEEEAKERAGTYLRTHFTDVDLGGELKVWPFVMDDDYDMDAPWALPCPTEGRPRMAKQSGYLKRRKARDGVMEQAYKQTYQQYMTDMFIIALNDPAVMGKDVLGYKRLMRVLLAVEANYDRFFDALTKNAEADYARVKMDAIMQNICPPEKFIPFEKRYEWLPEITYEPRSERMTKTEKGPSPPPAEPAQPAPGSPV